MGDGGWEMEDGRWRMGDGGWEMEDGRCLLSELSWVEGKEEEYRAVSGYGDKRKYAE